MTAREAAENLIKKRKSIGSAENAAKKILAYNNTDTSAVNDEYIKKFQDDVNTYFESASNAINGVKWANANSS